MAGGNGDRWRNYLGVPKHLIVIEGCTILERQVRMLRKRGVSDIAIVGPRVYDERYHVHGTTYFPSSTTLPPELALLHPDGAVNNALVSEGRRSIILLGDVFYTDEAMDKICFNENEQSFNWYGRPGESGASDEWYNWGELWAIVLNPEVLDLFRASVLCIARDDIARTREIYTLMASAVDPTYKRPNCKTPVSCVIDDDTNDFDYPFVYNAWLARRIRNRCVEKG